MCTVGDIPCVLWRFFSRFEKLLREYEASVWALCREQSLAFVGGLLAEWDLKMWHRWCNFVLWNSRCVSVMLLVTWDSSSRHSRARVSVGTNSERRPLIVNPKPFDTSLHLYSSNLENRVVVETLRERAMSCRTSSGSAQSCANE